MIVFDKYKYSINFWKISDYRDYYLFAKSILIVERYINL